MAPSHFSDLFLRAKQQIEQGRIDLLDAGPSPLPAKVVLGDEACPKVGLTPCSVVRLAYQRTASTVAGSSKVKAGGS